MRCGARSEIYCPKRLHHLVDNEGEQLTATFPNHIRITSESQLPEINSEGKARLIVEVIKRVLLVGASFDTICASTPQDRGIRSDEKVRRERFQRYQCCCLQETVAKSCQSCDFGVSLCQAKRMLKTSKLVIT